jgi:hypothetical protein
MTGTLWNYQSFPKFYDDVITSDSLARTLSALWKSESTRKVRVVETPGPHDQVEAILKRVIGKSNEPLSIVDQGGFFKGRSNQEVVKAMMALKDDQGRSYSDQVRSQLLFYDAEHEIQLMEDQGDHQAVRPYVKRATDETKTGAFWDIQHTTGSDLKVNAQTVAILTQSKFSILRDLLQSAWRLRGLEQNQSVILTITQDDLRIMSKLLVEVYGPSQVIEEGVQEVELEKILLYLATNEAMKAADVNYRSVKAFQRSLIVEHVYHALVSPKLFREQQDEYINVFNVVKGFFSSPRGEKIYQRYGIPIVKANTMDVLKKEIEQSLNPDVERLFHHPKSLKVKFEKEITSRQEELSAQVLTANSIQLDENLEIEGEEEQEPTCDYILTGTAENGTVCMS